MFLLFVVFHHTDTHIYILSLALALSIHNKQTFLDPRQACPFRSLSSPRCPLRNGVLAVWPGRTRHVPSRVHQSSLECFVFYNLSTPIHNKQTPMFRGEGLDPWWGSSGTLWSTWRVIFDNKIHWNNMSHRNFGLFTSLLPLKKPEKKEWR